MAPLAHRGGRRWAAAMVVALAVGGCTEGGESITMVNGDPLVFVADTEFYYDTGLGGTISCDDRTGCLLLQSPERNGIVWPRVVSPVVTEDGRRGVDHPEFGEIAEGDEVLLRGHGVDAGNGDGDVRDEQQIYDQCDLNEKRSSVIRIVEVRDVTRDAN